MKLSILQAYCLDEMEIESFVSRETHASIVTCVLEPKAYWVIHQKNQDANLEQQNQQLLENILKALSWDRKDIQYCNFNEVFEADVRSEPTVCGLCFGGNAQLLRESVGNNSKIVLLPALEIMHDNAVLKRETWNRIKQFKV